MLIFGRPAAADAPPFATKCWYCEPSLGLGRHVKVVRGEIERILRATFVKGSVTSDTVVNLLHIGRVAVWGDADAGRLVLQLVASGILQYSANKLRGSVLLNWGVGDVDLAYTDSARWTRIATH